MTVTLANLAEPIVQRCVLIFGKSTDLSIIRMGLIVNLKAFSQKIIQRIAIIMCSQCSFWFNIFTSNISSHTEAQVHCFTKDLLVTFRTFLCRFLNLKLNEELVLFIKLSFFRSGLVTKHLTIAHKPSSRGTAANIVVRWSFPTKHKFNSAQVINGPQYTGLVDHESALIVKVKPHFTSFNWTFNLR